MDSASFDFPTNVTRGTDMSSSTDNSRTGHFIYPPLSRVEVDRGRATFRSEWDAELAASGLASDRDVYAAVDIDALAVLRQPVARATCAAVLGDLDIGTRDLVATQVLAWIDALAPVISSRRAPGRWSRARRGEYRARSALEATLADVGAEQGIDRAPPVVANLLAAGIQVPIAAGAWLLVHLAAYPNRDADPVNAVWEALRLTPPTWVTARVTATPVEVAGQRLPAGAVVLVSPLLLGRLSDLVPDNSAGLATFCPDRWSQDGVRPGAWLPFGAGAHACPGRTLGLALLRDLASWASSHRLTLTAPVTIDQSRGILPVPSRITVLSPDSGASR